MESFLAGKNAVVTGGTRGIGYAIAQALLKAGASVVVCGRSRESTEKAVAELKKVASGRIVGAHVDLRSSAEVSEFFSFVDGEIDGLDILVNNAGIGKFASTAALSIEDWQAVIETNLSGVFYCSHEALSRLLKRGGGNIINISSLAGKNAFAGGAAYNASKFGVNGFSEAMMLDHRNDNVRVSYIMPGSVATEFSSGGSQSDWKIAPQDIADIVLMLLRMPARTLVSRVEVRPSRPGR